MKAPPDGYTLLQWVPANVVNNTLYQNLNFNFLRDIAPVAGTARSPYVLVVNPDLPVKTVPEFIAHAKANPGKLNFASAGVGTGIHMAGELFKMMAGVEHGARGVSRRRQRDDRPDRRPGAAHVRHHWRPRSRTSTAARSARWR